MIEFKKTKGRKSSEDEILWVKAKEFTPITNDEILGIISHIFENEEKIYRRKDGFKGASMFLDEILNIYTAIRR